MDRLALAVGCEDSAYLILSLDRGIGIQGLLYVS